MTRRGRILLNLATVSSLALAVICGWRASRAEGAAYFAWYARGSAFLVLPCLRFFAFIVRAERAEERKTGLCPTCGYDLRATPDRCPECGSVPGAAKANATKPRSHEANEDPADGGAE